ncbi:MAG TPA: histidine kinase [Terriglobales bacterium]|nr:histidine kinase [Terriglobales bacterium]
MFAFDESWAPHEKHRIETVLASARLVLSGTFLVIVFLSTASRGSGLSNSIAVAALYFVYSGAILATVTVSPRHTTAFLVAVHVADMLWPSAISVAAEGPNSPVFVLYIFVLFAAAYRWGFQLTTVTTLFMVILLRLESIFPGTRITRGDPTLMARFSIRASYMIVTGLFAGFLGEQQNRARAEEASLARLMTLAQMGTRINEIIGNVLKELLALFEGDEAVFYLDDHSQRRGRVWRVTRQQKRPNPEPHEIPFGEIRDFDKVPSGSAARLLRRDRLIRLAVLLPDNLYQVRQETSSGLLNEICDRNALAVRFSTPDWSGLTAIINNNDGKWGKAPLHFLQRSIKHLIPAVYSIDLNERLRSEAGAAERARLGRELHDGVVQSLFGLEMQAYLLRNAAHDYPSIGDELQQMQTTIHEQLQQLREMVQRSRTIEVTSDRLLEFLSSATSKFANDTYISAHFESNVPPGTSIDLSEGDCRELARIAHEAMVNVRKHSRAKAMLIRLMDEPEFIRLTMEDDGRGLAFQGRLNLSELDAAQAGPAVIKDCVRALGAELYIESHSWKGTFIEVIVPKEVHAARVSTR